MGDPTTDVVVNRLVRQREALEAKLALQRQAVQWLEAILWSDDTDCRKQDKMQEVLAGMRGELSDERDRQDRAA